MHSLLFLLGGNLGAESRVRPARKYYHNSRAFLIPTWIRTGSCLKEGLNHYLVIPMLPVKGCGFLSESEPCHATYAAWMHIVIKGNE